MLIRNVHIANNETLQDVRITDGKFAEISDHIEPAIGEEVIDGKQGLMLPPYVDPHVHLDATMTAGEPEWNETGTLFDGIRIWSERKKSLTVQDVKDRARRALELMASNGIQFVRSHVDVTDPTLTALHALLEVREEVKDFVELQLVAFPQEGILSFPNGKDLMRQAIAEGADVVGGIPHFEFTNQYGDDSLQFLMELAADSDKLVDVHCDEIDDPNSRHLEVLATLALEMGLKDKVTASHTTAFGSYNDAYAYKLMRLLGMSGINFVSNPLVNMHLGGRFDTYPKRRGLTRVKELTENGINVAFGEDDLRDPWSPLGTGNMIDVVRMGVYAAQTMGYTQLQNAYKYVTENGAKAMHVTDHYGIEVGKPASFVVMDAKDFYGVLNTNATMLLSVHNGKVIVTKQAPVMTTNF
ncbi:cytosine deaminase [Bifidobacterium dolichotidis]|uniref:Cytosine deaminase n=1 Tax=Bifidobacterium dolichotidis TaxID=2306976 RepID=A0A430FT79_9BIFI|nr:cytosine deaminase [Bifidobacterium dolichotidis]RSX56061.1 cytosine deaminase [Bifidobacterium dolichotidis]